MSRAAQSSASVTGDEVYPRSLPVSLYQALPRFNGEASKTVTSAVTVTSSGATREKAVPIAFQNLAVQRSANSTKC